MGRKGPWMDQIRSEVARGLYTYRVHVVRGPSAAHISDSSSSGDTRATPRPGELIRVLDLAEQPAPAALVGRGLLADRRGRAVRMRYDRPAGSSVPRSCRTNEVSRYRASGDAAWEAAVPFSAYWAAHPQYRRNAAARPDATGKALVTSPNPLSQELRALRGRRAVWHGSRPPGRQRHQSIEGQQG